MYIGLFFLLSCGTYLQIKCKDSLMAELIVSLRFFLRLKLESKYSKKNVPKHVGCEQMVSPSKFTVYIVLSQFGNYVNHIQT